MKRVALLLLPLLIAAPAFGATDTYQVTGPVVDVTDDKIVVQRGKEKWEIARDPSATKMKGDAKEIKKGDRVTVEYRMSAASIEVKSPKGASKRSADRDRSGAEKGAAGTAPSSQR